MTFKEEYMPTLYVMCGVAGSGKSTFIRNHMNLETDNYVSRDEIRFFFVKENEEYFSKEKQVFREFVGQINTNLSCGYNVFADATHINFASRNKLLRAINHKFYSDAIAVWINTPLNICLQQNEKRAGTRGYVPPEVIKKMYSQFEEPTFDEGFSSIYIIKPNEPIIIKKKG